MSLRYASVLLAAALAACQPKDKPAEQPAAAPAAPPPQVIHVASYHYAFDAPSEIASGPTTFYFKNNGPGFHHLQIVRIDSGKTFADLTTALKKKGPPPAWMAIITGANAPDPGSESNVTVDLPTGNYAFLCFVDMPEGMPHFMKGMASPFTVKPASEIAHAPDTGAAAAKTAATPAAAAPSAPDITVTLKDYGFDLSKEVTAGTHTFEVHTSPGQPHEIELIRLAPGKTAEDLMSWMKNMKGPPPGSGIGGAAGTSAGVTARFTATFTPGDYLLICFMPDAKDGKPHFMHGMMHTIKVT